MPILLIGWLSQVDFESKQPDESNLDLGMQASFHLSNTVLQGNSGTSKTDRISLWNFVSMSGLRKIRHGK